MNLARRSFAKVVAGVTVPTLSGCLASPSSTRVDYDPFWSWLYSPQQVSTSPYGAFYSLNLTAIRTYAERFDPQTYRKYRSYVGAGDLEWLGLSQTDVTDVLMSYPVTSGEIRSMVFTGSFSRKQVQPRLEGTYENHTRSKGFDLYWTSQQKEVAVGVHDGIVALGYPTGAQRARGVLGAMLRAKRGPDRRYVNTDDDFGLLIETLGGGDDVSGITHEPRAETRPSRGVFRNEVAKGHRYVFGQDVSKSRYVFVFETENDVDTDAVTAWVDANDDSGDRLFGAYRTTAVSKEGRTAVVDGVVETEGM